MSKQGLCAVGGEKDLWAVEMGDIWTVRLMFSNSTFPLTQSSNEGPKMFNVVLINTNLNMLYKGCHMCVCLPFPV